MSINPIQGGPQGPPPQQVRLAPPPRVFTPRTTGVALPTDTLGIQSKGGPINRFSSDRRLSDLKPDELASLGGGSALETLARVQSNLTIGEARPLLGNKPALESIAGLISERSDIKVSDFVSRDIKGRTIIDPSYKDSDAMQLLKDRQDVMPSELSAMRSNFTKRLKNPQMGKQASEKGLALLKDRSDLKPEDVTDLFGSLYTATGADKKGGAQGGDPNAAPQAALDMFDSASELLRKRGGMDPDRVAELATSIGSLGSPKDKQKPGRVAESFAEATKSLENNSLREPEELTRLASTISDHFPGNDEKSSEARLGAFKTGAKMMGENTQVNARDIDGVFRRAKESDPKLSKGSASQQSKALAGVFNDVSQGVSNGTLNTANLGAHFDNKNQGGTAGNTRRQNRQGQQRQDGGINVAQQGQGQPTPGQTAEAPRTQA